MAWHPLGWQAAWLSEIEPFPSAVLKHHYPDVPNLGDMTTLPDRIASGEVEAPDLFCGGTPCQAFSVAGLRKSLDDARGNLSMTFCEIANAIDTARAGASQPPAIIFWENVPGVLSTKDNAFGCFIAGLAGETDPVEPPRGKWPNAGVVLGPQRTVAWRILDAQYFGVAQRRRRVFVVASARDGFDPASVLLEFDGVRRDSAPSREAGQKPAPCVTNGPPFRRTGNERVEAEAMVIEASRSHWDGDYPHPTLNQSAKGSGGVGSSNQEIFSQRGAYLAPQPVITMAHGQGGAEIATDRAPTLTCNHEAPIVARSLLAGGHTNNPLDETLVAQPMPINTMVALRHEALGEGTGFGIGDAGDPAYTLTKGHSHAVAQVVGALACNTGPNGHDAGNFACNQAVDAGHVLPTAMQVRRLTPVECERLQGFPDNYTAIPWRKKPSEECPDGPRYKALGNSWAVPVVRWIGKRIQEALT